MATSESIFESLEVIETEVVENAEVKARDEEKKVANTLCSLADGRIDEEVESACEALVLARESVNIQALDLEGEEDESEVLVLRDGGNQVLVWREGKGMVFRDEGKQEEMPRRRTTSRCRKNPTEWPHWLPHDWSVWRVPRTRGKSKGHVDVPTTVAHSSGINSDQLVYSLRFEKMGGKFLVSGSRKCMAFVRSQKNAVPPMCQSRDRRTGRFLQFPSQARRGPVLCNHFASLPLSGR
ncbi:hypothetical protein Nepgr_000105 [Nepenthes gracilis]|uniref:Uncharacterized protein n=1 Tax=Nepenthes gracilis TaxID=150966 RepID=A0AAD3RW60_NEPGR|nr:hypothetical protein Nepgr_000105 [Nepenthes gracilis]